MSKKTKLTVTTSFGTFTRTTARTYTHLVVACGYKAERLEAGRLAAIKNEERLLAKYRRTVETGQCQEANASAWTRQCTAEFLADGSYQQWIANKEAEIARLTALGPITEDRESWALTDTNLASPATWFVLGWNGRLDLARKLAASEEASRYRTVIILDAQTGEVVR